MQLPDVNVLIYAHRQDAPEHDRYAAWLRALVEAPEPFAVAGIVLAGFLRIVTNPKIFRPATPMQTALVFCSRLVEWPRAVFVMPRRTHWALNGVAHFHKQVPVCATRHDEDSSWPLDEPAAKYQGCLHRRRRPKDLGICHDSQEAGEHDLRDRERFRRLDQGSKPRRVSIVLGRVLPVRVD